MKNLSEYINEKLSLDDIEVYKPKTKDELKKLIDKLIKERGLKADLNDIDTSEIEDMSWLFYKSEFNGDISRWDVSRVTDMDSMFEGSKFNSNISRWNTDNIRSMGFMFAYSQFNGDISRWDVSKVKDMGGMFQNCPLELHPPKWYK